MRMSLISDLIKLLLIGIGYFYLPLLLDVVGTVLLIMYGIFLFATVFSAKTIKKMQLHKESKWRLSLEILSEFIMVFVFVLVGFKWVAVIFTLGHVFIWLHVLELAKQENKESEDECNH